MMISSFIGCESKKQVNNFLPATQNAPGGGHRQDRFQERIFSCAGIRISGLAYSNHMPITGQKKEPPAKQAAIIMTGPYDSCQVSQKQLSLM